MLERCDPNVRHPKLDRTVLHDLATPEDETADRVVLFAANHSELDRLLPEAIAITKPDGALWVAYPKLASGKSDLSRQAVHDATRLAGWTPVAQISMDDVWSAIRARPATPRR